MARTVTVIPANINPVTKMANSEIKKRRVAAYARVSTDSDEQFTSYEAQVEYYTAFICRHREWQFVKVYTDEGISGLNTKNRDGFNEMVCDAMNGEIDLILTKSVSRFARNTVDSLSTIRKLKDKGVEVYFEKENIWTFDGKGELLLTIMSSLAQEESRSISENVTWGQRRRFEQGKVTLPYKQFLGYERGETKDSPPVVNSEQAQLVRRIYALYMQGQTPGRIARTLTAEGIPTPAGKATWQASTIESILTNEKYKGSARLQKRFTVDFLSKKMKTNEGEVPQYYIEESHEAIIDPLEWESVQDELRRRKSIGRAYSSVSVLSVKLVCGDCGDWYNKKIWRANTSHQKTVWQCKNKYGKEKLGCKTPWVTENDVKARFMKVFNGLIKNREAVLLALEAAKASVTDTAAIEEEMTGLENELKVLAALMEKSVSENACSEQNQTEYTRRFEDLTAGFDATKARWTALSEQKSARQVKARAIERFLLELNGREVLLDEFDNCLWLAVVDRVVVQRDGTMTFCFTDGTEIDG